MKKRKLINRRWVKSLLLTFILFAIGFSDYLVEKGLRAGGWALAVAVILVWAILYVVKADKVLLG